MRFLHLWITHFCIFASFYKKRLCKAIFYTKSYPHPSVDNLIFLRKYAGFSPAENPRVFLQNLTKIFHGFYKKTCEYFLGNMYKTAVPFLYTSYLSAGSQYATLFIRAFGV